MTGLKHLIVGLLLAVESISPNFQVVGRVVEDGGGGPVAGVEVRLLESRAGRVLAAVRSGDDGSFSFPGHLSCSWIEVVAPDFARQGRSCRSWSSESLSGLAWNVGPVVLERGAELEGRIELGSGEPVAGAEVFVFEVGAPQNRVNEGRPTQQPSAVSDEDGQFVLRSLRKDKSVDIEVWAQGLARGEEKGVAPESATDPLVISLQRKPRFAGTVLDSEARPIRGALVAVRWADAPMSSIGLILAGIYLPYTHSDAAGRFELEVGVISQDPVRLAVDAPGFIRFFTREVRLEPGSRTENLVLTLQRGATVSGRVRTANNGPAALAEVRAFKADERELARRWLGANDHTDGDGYFRIQGARPGTQLIEVNLVDHPRLLEEIEVQPGDNWVDLQLDPQELQDVYGYVVDQDGTPLSGVDLTLTAHGRPIVPRQVATNVDGSFAFSDVAVADYLLHADLDGYLQPQREIQVRVGMEELTLELIRAARLSGRVTGLTQPELRRLRIDLVRDDGETSGARVYEDGTFESAGLLPGVWTLRAALLGDSERLSVEDTVVIDHAGQEVRIDVSFP